MHNFIQAAATEAASTDPWVIGAAMVAVLGAIATALGFILRLVYRTARDLTDLRGEPARPGFPARPGVLERLSANEAATTATRSEVSATRQDLAALSTQVGGLSRQIGEGIIPAVAQLQPNHGTSLHDKITQIALDTARTTPRPPGGTP